MSEEQVITAKEAAARLGCSLSMLYKLLRRGRLRGFAVGRVKRIYASSLDDYRKANRLPSPPMKPPPMKPPVMTRPAKPATAAPPRPFRHLR